MHVISKLFLLYFAIIFLMQPILAETLSDTPLKSGTESIIRIDNNKQEFIQTAHLVNTRNDPYESDGTVDFSLSSKGIVCQDSVDVHVSQNNMTQLPFLVEKDRYLAQVNITLRIERGPSARITFIAKCNGFVVEKDGWNEIKWAHTKLPKTDDMSILYEIKKGLFRDVVLGDVYPAPEFIYSDSGSYVVAWQTPEDNFLAELRYKYVLDRNSILIFIFGMFVPIVLSLIVEQIKLKDEVILNTEANKYHTKKCKLAESIKSENHKVILKKEAVNGKYDACGMCRP